MWDMHDGMGWWMLWGSIFWGLAFFALAALIAKSSSDPATETRGPDRALDALRERYAKGEIDREEFERIRSDLER